MRSSVPKTWLNIPRAQRPPVLCVDDDVGVVLTLDRILSGRFNVTAATGGLEALEAVRNAKTPFAFVISDIRMPDLGGIALMQCVRKLAPTTVRILHTAYPDRESTQAAIEHGGVFRILVKPCNLDLIVATAEAALREHVVQRDGAPSTPDGPAAPAPSITT